MGENLFACRYTSYRREKRISIIAEISEREISERVIRRESKQEEKYNAVDKKDK